MESNFVLVIFEIEARYIDANFKPMGNISSLSSNDHMVGTIENFVANWHSSQET